MAPTSGKRSSKKEVNREAWTAEEDEKLAQVIEIHGPTKWKSVADKAGLNRCGKSCRLRWMNYLRPNIKRGDISDQEEDLIIRLHKLLGNRWSLIAGRLPGRTDNEIKNYWNSHLRKKRHHRNVGQKQKRYARREDHRVEGNEVNGKVDTSRSMRRLEDGVLKGEGGSDFTFTSSSSLIDDDLCNYHEEYLGDFEWVHQFLEMGDKWFEV